MELELPPDFHHIAPKGFSYEVEQFKSNLSSIWLLNHGFFSYTSKVPRTIWGFYDRKKKCYYAPINSTKHGNKVDIKDTRCYTSMVLNLNPLERLLYG